MRYTRYINIDFLVLIQGNKKNILSRAYLIYVKEEIFFLLIFFIRSNNVTFL